MFNGLNMNLGNLSRLSSAKSRSISPENFTGEKGQGGRCKLEDGSAKEAARDLGQGWKVNQVIFSAAAGSSIFRYRLCRYV